MFQLPENVFFQYLQSYMLSANKTKILYFLSSRRYIKIFLVKSN